MNILKTGDQNFRIPPFTSKSNSTNSSEQQNNKTREKFLLVVVVVTLQLGHESFEGRKVSVEYAPLASDLQNVPCRRTNNRASKTVGVKNGVSEVVLKVNNRSHAKNLRARISSFFDAADGLFFVGKKLI